MIVATWPPHVGTGGPAEAMPLNESGTKATTPATTKLQDFLDMACSFPRSKRKAMASRRPRHPQLLPVDLSHPGGAPGAGTAPFCEGLVVGAVAAVVGAAVPAADVLGRRDHEQARVRVQVARLAGLHGGSVGLEDRRAARVVQGQPFGMGLEERPGGRGLAAGSGRGHGSKVTGASNAALRVARRSVTSTARPTSRMATTLVMARPVSQPQVDVASV